MAANAKEYKDLQQAASIADDALVATAEPNATELQTSTVTALAQKIQAINTDGPLAELELATAIGKQQLAEALTEKGVATTSSETLVQMADKVKDLVVAGTEENIMGPYVDLSATPSQQSTGANYMRSFRNPVTGEAIVLLRSTIYCIPDGNYATFDAFLAAATKTLDVSTENSAYTLDIGDGRYAISEDFTKIIVQVTTDYVNNVYDLSGSSIVKIGTVTKQWNAYRPDSSNIALHDNGDLVLYQTNSQIFKLYRISTKEEYTINVPNPSQTSDYLLSAIMKPSKIYVVKGGWGNSYTRIFTIPYTISEDGSVSFGAIVYTNSVHGSGSAYVINSSSSAKDWVHIPGQDDTPIWYTSYGASGTFSTAPRSSNIRTATNSVQIWVPNPGSDYVSIPVTYLRTRTSSSSETGNPACVILMNDSYLVESNGDILSFKFYFKDGTMNINRASGEITYSDEWNKYLLASPYLGSSMRYSRMIFRNETGMAVGTGGAHYGYVGSYYVVYPIITNNNAIYAKRTTRNGLTAYYDPTLSIADIKSGAYDAETTIVPLPESDAQESN